MAITPVPSRISSPAARWLWLVLALGALPACFLPEWDERSWVDDDDVADDDDVTDDDDDVAEPITFSGDVDVDVSYEAWFDSDCQGPMVAELDADRVRLLGDGNCDLVLPTIGTVDTSLALDCDVTGSAVSGTMLMYDATGTLPLNFTTTVNGSYDEDAGTITATVTLNSMGIVADGTLDLEKTD